MKCRSTFGLFFLLSFCFLGCDRDTYFAYIYFGVNSHCAKKQKKNFKLRRVDKNLTFMWKPFKKKANSWNILWYCFVLLIMEVKLIYSFFFKMYIARRVLIYVCIARLNWNEQQLLRTNKKTVVRKAKKCVYIISNCKCTYFEKRKGKGIPKQPNANKNK